MSAIAYNEASMERLRSQPDLAWWIAASIALHLLALLWLLLQPDTGTLTMSDRAVQDRPPVEMVQVRPMDPSKLEEPQAIADRPHLEMPPVHRQAVGEYQIVDPVQLQRFLAKEAARENAADGGAGMSWATCSLLAPQRRVMEPACDGMLLAHHAGAGVAVSLEAPDSETLAAIKKFQKEEATRKSVGDDNENDRSYRDHSDEVFGPKPWER